MLVTQIQALIPGFARRRFDADDVLQAAFARAWTSIQGFRYEGEGSFRCWLATLVVNEFRDQLGRQRTERKHRAEGDHEEQIAGLADEADVRRQELREEHVALLESLGLLSDEDRDILILRHFEKLSFAAIGDVLNCDREGARRRYLQAQERLLKRRGA
jgi:RNA polymerase sigma-70 factor (ECF subfamily)